MNSFYDLNYRVRMSSIFTELSYLNIVRFGGVLKIRKTDEEMNITFAFFSETPLPSLYLHHVYFQFTSQILVISKTSSLNKVLYIFFRNFVTIMPVYRGS